jgi:hypothetical protein
VYIHHTHKSKYESNTHNIKCSILDHREVTIFITHITATKITLVNHGPESHTHMHTEQEESVLNHASIVMVEEGRSRSWTSMFSNSLVMAAGGEGWRRKQQVEEGSRSVAGRVFGERETPSLSLF